jgi:glycosyltransferase involved in cell wall biosynthesis
MTQQAYRGNRLAVILPCYNEGPVIKAVVEQFRSALPDALIYVFDNASSDNTATEAKAAGAIVRKVTTRGKGNVVRRMFADVDADIYVMADGDGTYETAQAPAMVNLLLDDRLDMVVGTRIASGEGNEYRLGHRTGNVMLTGMVGQIFGSGFTDMLSGYRVMSRRFVKSFPALSKGFEIETELTIHALELRAPYAEHPTEYRSRPEGTASKLATYRDGFQILKSIARLYVRERPRQLYLTIGMAAVLISVLVGLPVVIEFWETGLVPRLPTAILAGLITIAGLICGAVGVILDSVVTGRAEAKRLHYLAIGGVTEAGADAR